MKKKAIIIGVYDVIKLATFAETFIVALAQNDRQIQAVIDLFRDEHKVNPRGDFMVDGQPQDGWVAIQYDDICVHLLLPAQHDTYRLDSLFTKMIDKHK